MVQLFFLFLPSAICEKVSWLHSGSIMATWLIVQRSSLASSCEEKKKRPNESWLHWHRLLFCHWLPFLSWMKEKCYAHLKRTPTSRWAGHGLMMPAQRGKRTWLFLLRSMYICACGCVCVCWESGSLIILSKQTMCVSQEKKWLSQNFIHKLT